MRELAIVKEIRKNESTGEDEIMVLPMIVNACATCRTGCAKQGKMFRVLNKTNLNLKPGTIVRIGHSKPMLAINGFFAFIGPIISAIIGFIFSDEVASLIFQKDFVQLHFEEIRATTTIAFLILTSAILFAISRSSIHFKTPEVYQIV